MKGSQKRRMYIVSSCLTSVWILIHIWIIVLYGFLEWTISYSWDYYLVLIASQVNGDLFLHNFILISLLILSSYYDCQNCLNKMDQRLTSQTERDASLSEFILSRSEMIKQSVSAANIILGFPLFITIGYVFVGFSGVLST